VPSGIAPVHTREMTRRRRRADELLIDCEEGPTLRAVVVGMLREADRQAN
jgi:hypothetical protein